MMYLLVVFLLSVVLVLPILAFAPMTIHHHRFHNPTTPRVVYSRGSIQIPRKNPVGTHHYHSFNLLSTTDNGFDDDDDDFEYFDMDKELSEEDILNVMFIAEEFGNQNLSDTVYSGTPERLKTFRSEYPFLFYEMQMCGGDINPEIPGSVYYALRCYNEANPRKVVRDFFESKQLKVLCDNSSSNKESFNVCVEWEWDPENGYKTQYHATVPPLERIDCVYRSDIPFHCGDIVLANRTQDGIKQFANEIAKKLGSDSELTLEEMEERALDFISSPYDVFSSDTEDIKDLPSAVWEACIVHYITESVDAVETIIGDNDDVKLSVRSTKNETTGNFCILECEREGNRANEHYLVPFTNDDQSNLLPYQSADQRFLRVTKVERQDIPVQWQNIAAIAIQASIMLILALALAKIMKVPNFGFGEGFSVIPSAMLSNIWKSLFTKTEEAWINLVYIAIGLSTPLIIILFSDTDYDFDEMEWITKVPSYALANFKAHISYLGTRAGPFATLLSAFLKGVMPGVSEELLFRGVLQTTFTRWFGLSVALPLQAVLFGIMHSGYKSKAYVALAGVVGCLMGAIFSWTGNLAIPMLIHAANNTFVTLFVHSVIKTFTAYDLGELYAKHSLAK